jgi:hypothetical protein
MSGRGDLPLELVVELDREGHQYLRQQRRQRPRAS